MLQKTQKARLLQREVLPFVASFALLALLALAFFAAIALWLVPVLAVGLSSGNPEHAEYLRNILFKQTAQRYADPWHHTEPFWYFSQVVLFFWLPFSLALPWLVKPWAQAWRQRDARVWLPLACRLKPALQFAEAEQVVGSMLLSRVQASFTGSLLSAPIVSRSLPLALPSSKRRPMAALAVNSTVWVLLLPSASVHRRA